MISNCIFLFTSLHNGPIKNFFRKIFSVVNNDAEPPRQLDYLNEDDSEDDEFVVTIGDIKANVPFQKQNRSGVTNGTIDLDTNPALKDGMPKDDLDLASMEDKTRRKPGADLMKVLLIFF